MPSNVTEPETIRPGLVDETHHRQHRDALAAARFADEAEHFPAAHREVDAVDGVNLTRAGLEPRPQVSHLEQRGSGLRRRLADGGGDLGRRTERLGVNADLMLDTIVRAHRPASVLSGAAPPDPIASRLAGARSAGRSAGLIGLRSGDPARRAGRRRGG